MAMVVRCSWEVHWHTSREWVLKTVGKGVLSGRDMCLLEHLPRLVAAASTSRMTWGRSASRGTAGVATYARFPAA